jgi:mRNA interferase MazF
MGATRGHEQSGRRPVLIVSDDIYNAGPADMVIVLSLTSTRRPVASRVPVDPPEAGITRPSDIQCDGIRAVAKERLIRRWGSVSAETMQAVEYRLRALLRLP